MSEQTVGCGVYALWWQTDRWRAEGSWHHLMYVGSTGDLTARLRAHRGGRHNTELALLLSSETPALFWWPTRDRVDAYRLERMLIQCAIDEHDWSIGLLGLRHNTVPRRLLNNHRPAVPHSSPGDEIDEHLWLPLRGASRLLERLAGLALPAGAIRSWRDRRAIVAPLMSSNGVLREWTQTGDT